MWGAKYLRSRPEQFPEATYLGSFWQKKVYERTGKKKKRALREASIVSSELKNGRNGRGGKRDHHGGTKKRKRLPPIRDQKMGSGVRPK